MSGRWELHEGDNASVLAKLEAGSVDAVISDPPYGTGGWQRDEAGQGGDPQGHHVKHAWDSWDPAWVKEAHRVTRGPIAFFLPQTRVPEAPALAMGKPWRFFLWVKPDPRPRFASQVAYGFEPILVISMPRVRLPLNEGIADWMLASSPREGRDREGNGHPHQKPLAVLAWLVRMLTDADDVVLDPFAGSGTTGLACLRAGRRFIGVEQDTAWASIARKRLESVPSRSLYAYEEP